MPLEIPKTRARLQPYIKLFATKGGYDGTEPTPNFEEANLQLIGAAKKVGVDEARSIGMWRELNADTLGRIQETYPNLPTYKLSLERVTLYRSFLLDEFGFGTDKNSSAADLIMQSRPMVIEVKWFSPNSTTIPIKSWQFFGCWFENNKVEADVEAGDLRIVQSADLTCAGVIES